MNPRRTARRTAIAGLAIATLTLPALAGCSSDDTSSTTSSSSSTTGDSTTTTVSTDPATNIEALSYLMQGLLTTSQIGGGWLDQGRVVVPPSSEPTTGPLCPDGLTLAEPIGTTLNVQVHTTYLRTTDTTDPVDTSDSAVNPTAAQGMIMESLLWNERQKVDDAFAAMAAAAEACVGEEWVDPDMGATVGTSFEAPTLGTSSFTMGIEPATPSATDPWFETKGISILMSDPSSPTSIVITVSMTVVHNNPDPVVAEIDTDELIRVAEAAVARIMDGL